MHPCFSSLNEGSSGVVILTQFPVISRPIVVQDRNLHSLEADFMAEQQLYEQTKAFVSHIIENYVNNTDENYLDDFPNSIKKLWIDLYENGFVEIEDVQSITLWLKALSDVGYKFPGKQGVVQVLISSTFYNQL